VKIFAIADLHLSFSVDKPMDVFGEHWKKHDEKMEIHWNQLVSEDDIILIPGDISWAMNLEDAMVDLEWIKKLPGKKIISKGNHDYWWASVNKMNKLYDNIQFLYNNYYSVGDTAICGTRGWVCPNDAMFTEHDQKIYDREAIRLRYSLEMAKKDGFEDYIVMLHYPPTNDKKESSLFTEIIEEYNVRKVVYGHLHSAQCFEFSLNGMINGTEYSLVSCDALDFKVKNISG